MAEENKTPETKPEGTPAPEGEKKARKPRLDAQHHADGHKRHAGERTKRHQKSPKWLIIVIVAVGLAIVGVALMLASGGGMSKEDIESAKAGLKKVILALTEGRDADALPLMGQRELIQFERPEEFGIWDKLEPARLKEVEKVVLASAKKKTETSGLKDAASFDAIIAGSTVEPLPQARQVRFMWKQGDKTWNAKVRRDGNSSILILFDPAR